MDPRRSIAAAGGWLAFLLGLAAPSTAPAQEAIFVVRHAEKAASPSADPPLSAQGKQRAEALRDLLKEAGITAIFTSPFQRTKETAKPLATALGITPQVDPMSDPQTLVGKLRGLSGKGSVLVVGHSDTVPELLKAIGHPSAPVIAATEFDNLFVVTPGEVTRPRVLRLHYKP